MAHVLVIDDDPSIRMAITYALGDEGHRVDEASDGWAALAMVAQRHPDIILLDMRMPGLDGWEFAKLYRERYGHRAPIIVLTAAQDSDAAKRGAAVNAEGFLAKPFDLDVLLERVSAMGGGIDESRSAQLIEPTADLQSEFLSMIDDYRDRAASERSYQRRYEKIRQLVVDNFSEYVRQLELASHGIGVPADRVPETAFWLLRERTVIGTSRLRHYLTSDLELEGGHIGYDVRPSERRKGYGTRLLALTLGKARDLGLRRVLVTCDTENVGSARIIQKNGGKLKGEAISPESGKLVARYWIDC